MDNVDTDIAVSISASHNSRCDVGPLPNASKSVSNRYRWRGRIVSGSMAAYSSDSIVYLMVLRDGKAVLSTVVYQGVPVYPLLVYDVKEFCDKLLPPRVGEELRTIICETTGVQALEIRPSRKQSHPSRSVVCTRSKTSPSLEGIQSSIVTNPLPRR